MPAPMSSSCHRPGRRPPPIPTRSGGRSNDCAARGVTDVVTTALSEPEQAGFLAAGLQVRERLHLLERPVADAHGPGPDTTVHVPTTLDEPPRLRRAR
ncbi:MAG: hypothetical protein U5R31_15795 [Acidimicrobiia bacterium]|nr:hypothetical protein [Acidimicrobiia bacterium]